ncbi:TldD/PmbA family protein [Patescibacteria group bacterium]
MNNTKKIATDLIKQAKLENVYLVLRFQKNKVRMMNVKNGTIDRSEQVEVIGTGIHTFTESGHSGFASVDTIQDNKRLLNCLKIAIAAAKTAKKQKFEKVTEIYNLKPQKDKIIQKVLTDPFQVANKKLEEDLLSLNKLLLKKYPKTSISNTAKFFLDHIRIFRSDGTDVEFSVSNSNLFSVVTINQGNNVNEVFQSTYGFGFEVIDSKKSVNNHKKLLNNKLQYVLKLNSAKRLKGGNYPLLLDSSIAGVFMHEAFGHTAESDNVYHSSPLLKNGKIDKGKVVAKKFVNVIEGINPNTRGFYPYSGFGIKRKKIFIVKNGKVNDLISDVITAKKAGVNVNGGSRAESYSNIPVPRMSQTKITLDKKNTIPLGFNHLIESVDKIHSKLKKEKVFKKHKEIVYLVGSSGGNVDSYHGNFQFNSVISFKLTENNITLIKPVAFSGKTLEALKSAELALGKSYQWPGFCGKDGQTVIVNTKAPMLLLSKNKYITVG